MMSTKKGRTYRSKVTGYSGAGEAGLSFQLFASSSSDDGLAEELTASSAVEQAIAMIEETSVPGDRSLDPQGMARFPVIVLEPCDKSAELSLGKRPVGRCKVHFSIC